MTLVSITTCALGAGDRLSQSQMEVYKTLKEDNKYETPRLEKGWIKKFSDQEISLKVLKSEMNFQDCNDSEKVNPSLHSKTVIFFGNTMESDFNYTLYLSNLVHLDYPSEKFGECINYSEPIDHLRAYVTNYNQEIVLREPSIKLRESLGAIDMAVCVYETKDFKTNDDQIEPTICYSQSEINKYTYDLVGAWGAAMMIYNAKELN